MSRPMEEDGQVGQTKEGVQVLMEYLVGSLLCLKHIDIAKGILSGSQQDSVAKQVRQADVKLFFESFVERFTP